MVSTLDKLQTTRTIVKRQHILIELVGPAGAGKTTLSTVMLQRYKEIKVIQRFHPNIWRMADMPFFVNNAVRVLPTLFRLYSTGSCLTRREIALMLILNGWAKVLGQHAPNGKKISIIDQGAVIMMAQLYLFGPKSLRSLSLNKWWDSVYRQWARVLDFVVYLDASENILIKRINERNKFHIIKGQERFETLEFLSNYRIGYEHVISELKERNDGLKVFRLDTSRKSPDELLDSLRAEFTLIDDKCEALN